MIVIADMMLNERTLPRSISYKSLSKIDLLEQQNKHDF